MVSNPASAFGDLANNVGPGIAAYTGARLLHRIVFVLVNKKWPHLAKHAGVVASVATFATTWWFGHRVKALAKYHTPISIGTGIAAAQGLIFAYAPEKLGWIMGDVDPRQYVKLPPATPVPPEDFDVSSLEEPLGDGDYIDVDAADVDTSRASVDEVPIERDPGGDELDGLDPEDLGTLSNVDDEDGVFAAN
jgi:hypothetical protein